MSDNDAVRPSYELLAALVVSLREELLESRAALGRALTRIGDLEARLGQNSRNSSKPPSSDSPFVKPVPKSLRGISGRGPGGQPGHPGQTLMQVAEPDRVVAHLPIVCGGCGGGLRRAPVASVEVRQVFDIPKIAVTVTEHRLVTKVCVCGWATAARAPVGVSAPVQYGGEHRGDRHLPVCGAVPVQTAHRRRALGTVRHPAVSRHGVGVHDPVRA